MKFAIFCLLLVGSNAFPAEVEKDNKAVESKSVKSVVSMKETEKTKQPEKRAPVQTVVPGEIKYGSEVKYGSEIKYSPQYLQSVQEVKYVSPDPKSPYYEPPQPSPKPQYLFYSPSAPQASATNHHAMSYQPQAHLILMLAVPHPSGQYMMLYPAQNFLLPMYYRPSLAHQAASGSVPVQTAYQSASAASTYQPTAAAYQAAYPAPALAQHAGFVAQHQLAYAGPYRTDKYVPSKQQ